MKTMFPLAIAVVILFAVSMTLVAVDTSVAGETKEMAAQTVDMEAAKATFETTCSKCHALSRPLGKMKDQAGWESTVGRMSSYHKNRLGQEISEEDQRAIVQYLLSVAGK